MGTLANSEDTDEMQHDAACCNSTVSTGDATALLR